MKLSEAILAGSSLCKPARNPDDGTNKEGCALTMASLAVGAKSQIGSNAWHEAKRVWPWLQGRSASSCPVSGCSTFNRQEYWEHNLRVAHIFDNHVLEGDWTLEQLVDYVRSIEPAEEPETDPRDEEGSDVRPELERYRHEHSV